MSAVRTSIPLNTSLYLSPEQFAGLAGALHGSGVVDQLFFWDQLTKFWPRHLWSPENAPMAALIPDIDSYAEAFGLAAYAAAVAPGAGIAISTDAIRRGPAELTQMAWTLSNLSGAPVTIQIGAGEAKQTGPFGWKRSEGARPGAQGPRPRGVRVRAVVHERTPRGPRRDREGVRRPDHAVDGGHLRPPRPGRRSRAGLEPLYPEGWHYSVKLRPMDVSTAVSADVLARTTPAHCEAAFSHGTPAQVAAEVAAYVEAGCTHVAICDLLPLVLDPEDAFGATARSVEVCRLVKGAA